MNIALVQLPHFFGDEQIRTYECYPLGLGYISTFLTRNNIAHAGIDLWEKQYYPQEAIDNIDFSSFSVVGISVYSTQYKYLKEFSKLFKEKYPNIMLICGGPGPTFSYEVILKNTNVDICIIGEGEMTLLDLLLSQEYKNIEGIAYLSNGEVIKTPKRSYMERLDEIPFPNLELFNLESTIAAGASVTQFYTGEKMRSINVIAGRGCPYNCHFCSKTFSGLRLRSIDNLIEEIKQLREKYGINYIFFNDELVLVNKKRTLQLCSELSKLNMKWSCQGRINQVDEEIIKAMKDAGCVGIGYGVESISQSILDNMNKNIDASTIIPTLQITKAIGIKPIIQYMYGYPGETKETIKATLEFFTIIDEPFVGSMTTPIPGTKLYDECIQKGLITDEEDYLLRLDSGYNLLGTINLTEFSDEELLKNRRKLLVKITHNYYKKRPLQYLNFIFKRLLAKINKKV